MLQKNPYQLVALMKLRMVEAGFCLIADGVGVGKTISSGYVIKDFIAQEKTILIISPPSLVNKWILELDFHFGVAPRPIRSLQDYDTAIAELPYTSEGIAYVMNGALLRDRRLTKNISVDLLVVDEIHNYRNPETLSYKSLARFSDRSSHRIGLSATPINNGLQDLIAIFQILWPTADNEALEMAIRDIWESRLHRSFAPVVTRFEKENIGIHFARRIIRSHPIAYPDHYVRSVRHHILRRCKGKSAFEKLVYFRLAASSPAAISHSLGVEFTLDDDPKLAALKQITTGSGRTIVFCEFRKTVNYLQRELDSDVVVLTGDVPLDERQAALDAFREEENAILLMTSVGAEGLDVQFCSQMVNYDLHWNPMVLEQRIGRIDRRGQEKNEVLINNFHVQNSVDDAILERLQFKLSGLNRSVFQPKEIINDEEMLQLFDPSVVERELEQARQIKFAEKWAQSLQADDYNIAKVITPESCSIVASGAGASTEKWVPDDPTIDKWIDDLHKSWRKLKSTVEYYSE